MRSALSDEELMEQAIADESDAFRELVERLRPVVRGFLWRLGCSLSEVDDLAQETLIRLWGHRQSYHRGRPVRPYVLSIAKNVYLAYCERTSRETAARVSLAAPSDLDRLLLRDGWQVEGPGEALLAKYREFRLAQAVASLPPGERLVFVLKHHEGLKYEEIAFLLDIAEGTVKSRMFRAVRALRRALPDLEPGGAKEES